jgi:transcriptional regulator with XRE-family HTH domain
MGQRLTPLRLTTVRTRELGEELRQARIRTETRAEQVSRSLGWSASKLSRIEHGERGVDDLDLGALLGQLNVDKATRERVRLLAEERDLGQYLRPHDGLLSDNLLSLIIHERAALTMHKYEPMVIPGLLQTPAYARAMIELCGVESPDEVQPLVEARMKRQSVLTAQNPPPAAVFYIHEISLLRGIGTSRIMHDQAMRLRFMCDWPRLTLRVIPMSAPGNPLLASGFNLMTFAPPVKPVAYAETDIATVFTEVPESTAYCQWKGKVLASLALDAEQSQSVFAHWADFYDLRGDRDVEGSDVA